MIGGNMRKKIVYICLISLLVISIGLNIYLCISKYKNKKLTCSITNEFDHVTSSITYTSKVDKTGKVLNSKMKIVETYKSKEEYESNKKRYTEGKADAKYNDKKMIITRYQTLDEIKDEDGNEVSEWYVNNMNSYTKNGYKCTFK